MKNIGATPTAGTMPKIKEFIKALKQFDKLLVQIIKIVITIGTIWMLVKGTFL